MSSHLTIGTKLGSTLAVLSLALALHACADAARQAEPPTGSPDAEGDDEPAAPQNDANDAKEKVPPVVPGPDQVLDGVPQGNPVVPPPSPPGPTSIKPP